MDTSIQPPLVYKGKIAYIGPLQTFSGIKVMECWDGSQELTPRLARLCNSLADTA